MGNLKHGVKRANGGYRPGAGRKPDWFKAECRKLATSKKTLAFLKSVVEGDPVEEKKVFEGQEAVTVLVSASVDARIRAWNSLMDRGFGKPEQTVEHTGDAFTGCSLVIRGIDE